MLEPKDAQRYERELRAMLRRAGDEDPEGFAQVAQLLTQAVNALPIAAQLTRVQHGYSWTELAQGLGWSRQHAQQQLGRKLDAAAKGLDATQLHELLRQQVGLYEDPATEGYQWHQGRYVVKADLDPTCAYDLPRDKCSPAYLCEQCVDDLVDQGTDAAELQATDTSPGVTWSDADTGVHA